MTQLGEMGFSENLSRFALQTFNNNMELACQWLLASADDFESESEAENEGSQQNEGGEGEDEEAQQTPGSSSSGGGDTLDALVHALGDRIHQVSLNEQDSRRLRLRSMAPPSTATLQQERLMHAFQAMIENPREARSYLTDPEIGPILLQVQRAQRVSSGITPTAESNASNSTDQEDQSQTESTNEGEEA